MSLMKWSVIVAIAVGCQACAGAPPMPPDGAVSHDPVYVEHTDLLQLESFPVQIVLKVEGQLPDPCHQAVWTVSDPDPAGRIDVELHSEAPSGLNCIQVIQPVSLSIPIGSFESGRYSIWLNGKKTADFSV